MRKKALILSVVSLFSLAIYAQETETLTTDDEPSEIKTIFGKIDHHGGYGSLNINYTSINNKDAMMLGSRGAWIIDHGFAIGMGGYGFFTDYYYDDNIGEDVNISGGYGGLIMEPIFLPKFPIHLSVPLFVGVGGIGIINSSYIGDERDYYVEDSDTYFVLEPGIEIELNMLKFFRMAFSAYYRYTSDISLNNTNKDILHGFSTGLTLKFGSF